MIYSYLKSLFRKQPMYLAINFGGLVLGMTACLLILNYVRYENTYDLQSPNAPNIWRVFNQTVSNGSITMQDANTHSAIGPTLKKDIANVADYARLYCGNSPEIVVLAGNQPYEIKRFYATDPGFLRMFPQKIIKGDPASCLDLPYTAIITNTEAERIFGKENAIGKTLKITNGTLTGDYTITAIVAAPPVNTHLKFDLLVSYASRYAHGHIDNFESYWDYTYFQLKSNTSPAAVKTRLEQINKNQLKNEGIQLNIQPFTDIHLHSNLSYELEPNGSARIVIFLSIIAFCILFIALINFVNLTTAMANERAKEVGIRKALGASRFTLALQFIFENFLIAFSALIVAILLMQLSIEPFGQFIGKPLAANGILNDLYFWLSYSGLILGISLATSVYPAVNLSAYQPSQTLRGQFIAGSTANIRKSLVVVQFIGSVVLIIGVLVVKQQLKYLKNHDLGVSLEQIISLKSTPVSNDSLAGYKLSTFKEEAKKIARISQITASSIVPGLGINTISGSNRPLHWVKNPEYYYGSSYFINTDPEFFSVFGVKILAGQPKYYTNRAQRYSHLTINKSMLKGLGFTTAQQAIGQQIAYQNSENGATSTIDAVVDDFHIESLKNKPQPTMYYCFTEQPLNYLSFKIKTKNTQLTLATLTKLWKNIYPNQPFTYSFLDENFAHLYSTETPFSNVFGLFSILAIVISCLGLFGLVAYSVTLRKKEIGLRKVLGASITSITTMLTTGYLKLILIAIIIAIPVAYYAMNLWLQDFAYRTPIPVWIYIVAGIIAICIALVTVGFYAIKAALANPAVSLKTE